MAAECSCAFLRRSATLEERWSLCGESCDASLDGSSCDPMDDSGLMGQQEQRPGNPFNVGNSGGEKCEAKWGGKNKADDDLAVEFEWSIIGLKLAEPSPKGNRCGKGGGSCLGGSEDTDGAGL